MCIHVHRQHALLRCVIAFAILCGTQCLRSMHVVTEYNCCEESCQGIGCEINSTITLVQFVA